MIEGGGTVGTRTLTFGGPDLYYESMMDLVGTPAMDGLVGMRREHTICADSQVKFTAPNYGITTTSRVEWFLVADPKSALQCLGLEDWTAGAAHTPYDLGFRFVAAPDSPYFKPKFADKPLTLTPHPSPFTLTLTTTTTTTLR